MRHLDVEGLHRVTTHEVTAAVVGPAEWSGALVVGVDELDDLLHRGTGDEDALDAHLLGRVDVRPLRVGRQDDDR